MRDNAGWEKRCFSISLSFLFPDVLCATVYYAGRFSYGDSAKSRDVDQVDRNSDRLLQPFLGGPTILVGTNARFDRPRRSSRFAIGDERRTSLTRASEKLLLLHALAFGFEDRMHLDAVRSELCCVHDWSWIAIDRFNENESVLARASRSSDSFFLSLPCLSVPSWKVRYILRIA